MINNNELDYISQHLLQLDELLGGTAHKNKAKNQDQFMNLKNTIQEKMH